MAKLLGLYKSVTLPEHIRQALLVWQPQLQPEQVYALEQGLSNHNFLLSIKDELFLLKEYRGGFPEQTLYIQSELASKSLQFQRPKCWSKTYQLALFEFIHREPEAKPDFSVLKPLCTLHLHTTLIDLPHLDISIQLDQITSSLEHGYSVILAWALRVIKQSPQDKGICHNDLVIENLVAAQQGTVLIDFEYIALGDVYFDLAAIATSFNMNASKSKKLLESYYALIGKGQPEYAVDKLNAFRVAYALLSIDWYEQRRRFDKAMPLRAILCQLTDYIPPSLCASSLYFSTSSLSKIGLPCAS